MAGKPRIRGACDLKGASSSSGPNVTAHKLLMRLASIEMQRTRLGRERDQALERVKLCRDRCDALAREAERTIRDIKSRFPEAVVPSIKPPTVSELRSRVEGSKTFTHRY